MRLISKAVIVAAVPLLAAACSSASPASPASPVATYKPPATTNPDAGLLTGTQLKALLAPASWFPPGFAVDPGASTETGDTYQEPSPSSGAPNCANLSASAWVDLSGVGAVSWAQNDYVDKATSVTYAQEIDVYRGTSAQDAMAGLRKLASTCPSFQDPQTSSTVTVKLTAGPALGNDALTFTLDSPRWQGATTLEAVRMGTAVVTVLYAASSGTGATQAVNLVTAITANLKNKG
jgi:hypothetical protein